MNGGIMNGGILSGGSTTRGTTNADHARGRWRTSSRSGSQGGNCVEVATFDRATAVRDSKNRGGGMIVVSHDAWRTFVQAIKNGEFNRAGRA